MSHSKFNKNGYSFYIENGIPKFKNMLIPAHFVVSKDIILLSILRDSIVITYA